MAVVKADGYGHGATQVARTALAAGAAELGMATIDEALALRGGGSSRTARRALGCGTGGPRRSTLDRVLWGESPGSDVAGCPAGAVRGPVLDESGVAIVDPSADAGPHHDSLTGADAQAVLGDLDRQGGAGDVGGAGKGCGLQAVVAVGAGLKDRDAAGVVIDRPVERVQHAVLAVGHLVGVQPDGGVADDEIHRRRRGVYRGDHQIRAVGADRHADDVAGTVDLALDWVRDRVVGRIGHGEPD